MGRGLFPVAVAALLGCTSSAGTASPPTQTRVAAACPAGRALYADAAGRITARFHRVGARSGWQSDLALGVRSAPGRPEHWFLFDRGSARAVNLISTTDVTVRSWRPPAADGGNRPLGEMQYLAADARMAALPSVPTSRTLAPHLIVLPEWAEVLARRASPPEDSGQAILIFKRCGR